MLAVGSRISIFLLVTVIACRVSAEFLWKDVCTQDDVKRYTFCDARAPLDERVKDYVNRVPTTSQIDMMGNLAAGYPALHIPPYQWWSEGLHGDLQGCVSSGDVCKCPTSFPAPTGLGAALNSSLWEAIGRAIGVEGRAISNLREHNGEQFRGDGLTYWSPTINLQRDPRWGRNQEVPGEDPIVTSLYADAYIRGLQSIRSGSKYSRIQIAAGCKHFVANSLESWNNVSRHNFDARVSKEDLFNYYFPPFRTCAQQSLGLMCSYNRVNGVPSCTNDWLLKKVLREEWNFDGYVVTDCGALADVENGHHYTSDRALTSALALNATTDVNCGDGIYYPRALQAAYRQGLVTASQIAESFTRLARVQFKVGLFDPKEDTSPSETLDEDIALIDSPAHQQLAYEAALQSMVLLKNTNDVLPLARSLKLAVIGPHIHTTEALLSNYHGDRCCDGTYDCIETPLGALQKANTNGSTTGVVGCNVDGNDLDEIDKAVRVARESDAVVLFVGISNRQENEGLDRYETTLPGLQTKLVSAILDLGKTKTILVLFNGGALSLGQDIISKAPAILESYYGGQEGSRAVASIVYGDYNPTGKLVATMYPASFVRDLPLTEMGLNVGVGRTHLYYRGSPEFEFGHGLSYSNWHLDWTDNLEEQMVDTLEAGENMNITIRVRNGGPHSGGQTALLFWRPLDNQVNIVQKLVDFRGTRHLEQGEHDELTFSIGQEHFAMWADSQQSVTVAAGMYELEVRVGNNVRATRRLHVITTDMDSEPVSFRSSEESISWKR